MKLCMHTFIQHFIWNRKTVTFFTLKLCLPPEISFFLPFSRYYHTVFNKIRKLVTLQKTEYFSSRHDTKNWKISIDLPLKYFNVLIIFVKLLFQTLSKFIITLLQIWIKIHDDIYFHVVVNSDSDESNSVISRSSREFFDWHPIALPVVRCQ